MGDSLFLRFANFNTVSLSLVSYREVDLTCFTIIDEFLLFYFLVQVGYDHDQL
jgi:hypothetical protein